MFEDLGNGFVFAKTFAKNAYRSFFCHGNYRLDIGQFSDSGG